MKTPIDPWRWGATLGMALGLSFTPLPVAAEVPTLARGVNLSHWLQYQGRQPVTTADLELIRQAGFDHVRIPFDPARLGWRIDDEAPEEARFTLPGLDSLDRAVRDTVAAGLVAIVDFHPGEEARERIEMVRAAQEAMVRTWGHLAHHFRDLPPEKVVFELLNEPQYYKRSIRYWNLLHEATLAAVRQEAPDHLVLIPGNRGSDVEGVLRLKPARDPLVRYVFHFYEPYLVTHNGAPWEPFAYKAEGTARGLRYPAQMLIPTEITVKPGGVLRDVQKAAAQYQSEGWNRERIAERINVAARWAQENGVKLVCTEFGVLRIALEEPSRNRWLEDVRQELEKNGIGWSIWDYADLFGIAHTKGEVHEIDPATGVYAPKDPKRMTRIMDPAVLRSLGLGGN